MRWHELWALPDLAPTAPDDRCGPYDSLLLLLLGAEVTVDALLAGLVVYGIWIMPEKGEPDNDSAELQSRCRFPHMIYKALALAQSPVKGNLPGLPEVFVALGQHPPRAGVTPICPGVRVC